MVQGRIDPWEVVGSIVAGINLQPGEGKTAPVAVHVLQRQHFPVLGFGVGFNVHVNLLHNKHEIRHRTGWGRVVLTFMSTYCTTSAGYVTEGFAVGVYNCIDVHVKLLYNKRELRHGRVWAIGVGVY